MTKQQIPLMILGTLWIAVSFMAFINYSEAVASLYILAPATVLIGADLFSLRDVIQKGSS